MAGSIGSKLFGVVNRLLRKAPNLNTIGTITTGVWNGTAISNTYLANTTITVNGTSIALGGSGTATAAASTLTGTTLASNVVTSSLTSVGTIATGVWQGTSIANAYLANSSVTVNGTSIALGGSGTATAAASTLTGTTLASNVVTSSLTSLGTIATGVWQGTAIANAYLANSSVTVNGTSISLGSSGTVTAAASTLTGSTLASGVTASSLTSFGSSIALGTPGSGTLTNCTGYTEANLSTSDVTTNNVSTSKHGFAPKSPNDATKYLDGTGAYSVPAGSGGVGTIPCARAYVGTNQTITSSTDTKLALTAETFDTNNNFDSATNYRFTPTVAGKYIVAATAQINSIALNTTLIFSIFKNGSVYSRVLQVGPQTTAAGIDLTDVVDMNGSTDYIEIFMNQDRGSSQTIISGSSVSYASFCKIAGS